MARSTLDRIRNHPTIRIDRDGEPNYGERDVEMVPPDVPETESESDRGQIKAKNIDMIDSDSPPESYYRVADTAMFEHLDLARAIEEGACVKSG